MIIPRQPVKADYKVNEIGHFKSISAGAATKSFRVNSAGTSTATMGLSLGSSSWSASPFRVNYDGGFWSTSANVTGTITATGGSITGDLTVTGSLTTGSTSGTHTVFGGGLLSFKTGSTTRGTLYASSSGMMISANTIYLDGDAFVSEDLIVTDTIGAGGNITTEGGVAAVGNFVSTTGGMQVRENIISTSGKIQAQDWFQLGNEYQGTNEDGYGFLNGIKIEGGILKARYAEISVAGGIVHKFEEKDWYNVGAV